MKNFNKFYTLLSFAIPAVIVTAIQLIFLNDKAIECSANLLISRGKNSLNMKISQELDNGKGVWIISGSLNQDDKKYFIGKTVEFNYSTTGEFYKLTSTEIQNSPSFDIPSGLQEKWLTKFASMEGETLTIRIEQLNNNSWVIFAQTLPLYICEK